MTANPTRFQSSKTLAITGASIDDSTVNRVIRDISSFVREFVSYVANVQCEF